MEICPQTYGAMQAAGNTDWGVITSTCLTWWLGMETKAYSKKVPLKKMIPNINISSE